MSASTRAIARSDIQNYWLTKLDQQPVETVAWEYSKRNKKGYVHSIAFLKSLMEKASSVAGKQKGPLCRIFKTGQVGLTKCGKKFKVTKVITQTPEGAGKNCAKVNAYAKVEGIGLVSFNCNGVSKEGYVISDLDGIPAEKCGDMSRESLENVKDHLTISVDEVPLVVAFLKAIRSGK